MNECFTAKILCYGPSNIPLSTGCSGEHCMFSESLHTFRSSYEERDNDKVYKSKKTVIRSDVRKFAEFLFFPDLDYVYTNSFSSLKFPSELRSQFYIMFS
jgi:hypothetical protein